MSKKDFSQGLKALTSPQEPKAQKSADTVKSTKIGLREGETRATFIVREELLEKLRAVTFWERTTIRDVMAEMMSDYLNAYEVKAGKKIKAIPNPETREPILPKRVNP